MWVPDVYQGAPTPVTLLVSSAPKVAAFAMAFRIMVFGLFELLRVRGDLDGAALLLQRARIQAEQLGHQ